MLLLKKLILLFAVLGSLNCSGQLNGVLDLSQRNISDLNEIENLDFSVTQIILDGNPIDLSASIDVLEKFKNLQSISLKGCSIKFVPAKLIALKRLRSIDLSDNDLSFLPYSFKDFAQLRFLDLSGNSLDSMGFKLSRLYDLKSLDLSNNANLSLANQDLSLLNTEKLKLNGIKELAPKTVFNSSIKNLELESESKEDFSKFITDSSAITSLKIRSSFLQNTSPLIADLAKTSIQELELSGGGIKQISPLIGKLKTLERLAISSDKITKLPKSIAQLTNLKVLDISKTGIDSISFVGLQSALPNCMIISKFANEELEDEKPSFVEDVTATISMARENVIETENAKLEIPQGAFVNLDGSSVDDSIVVRVEEISDPVSLVARRLDMQVNTGGETEQFAVDRAVSVSASTINGDSVKINPGKEPQLSMKSDSSEAKTYVFSIKKKQWDELDSTEIEDYQIDSLAAFDPNAIDTMFFNFFNFSKRLRYGSVYLNIKKEESLGGQTIKLYGKTLAGFERKFKVYDETTLSFAYLNKLRSERWLIISKNADNKVARVTQLLNKKEKSKVPGSKAYLIKNLENVDLLFDTIRDVFVMVFETDEQRVMLDVIPVYGINDQIKGAQRDFAKILSDFKSGKERIDERRNGNVIKRYQNEYDVNVEKYESQFDSITQQNYDFLTYKKNGYLYDEIEKSFDDAFTFKISLLGIYTVRNYDTDYEFEKVQESSIIPVDSAGKRLAVMNMIILSKYGNTYRNGSPELFEYPVYKKVAILLLLANGNYAYLNTEDFKRIEKNTLEGDFGRVKFRVIDNQELEVNKFRKYLKI